MFSYDLKIPELEIETTECFSGSDCSFFLNMDSDEVELSITRNTGQSSTYYLYRSFFYLLSSAHNGYTHSIDFKVDDAPLETIKLSSNGMYYVALTKRNHAYIIGTFRGEMVVFLIM